MKKILTALLIIICINQSISQVRYATTGRYTYKWNAVKEKFENLKEFEDNSVFEFSSDYGVFSVAGLSNIDWVVKNPEVDEELNLISFIGLDKGLLETIIIIDNKNNEIRLIADLEDGVYLIGFYIVARREY